MRWRHDLIGVWRRLGAFFGRRRRDRDLEDELAFHLAMRQAEHERAGAGSSEARLAARRQFGNVTALKEQTKEMWTFPSFESIVQDIRYALRALRRTPGFSVVAVLVLAIGIGANTAIFSLVDALLVRGLPYPDPDRLVVLIGNVERAAGVERRGNSYPDHLDWRARSTSFDDMAAYDATNVLLTGFDEPERIPAEVVSAPYFAVLGVSPQHGRTFTPREDEVPNRDLVVVLSDGLWKRRFGADPGIVNRQIRLGTRVFTVVGVMPPGFTGLSDQAQVWMPFVLGGGSLANRGNRGFRTIARLKAGVSIDRARAELDAISQQLAETYRETNDKRAVEVSPLSVETFGQLRPVVFTLMGAVAFVLLIACANVANLLIGRSEVRQREIAVRSALGAGQSRLVRQLVTESCVLALLAAAAGSALAYLAVRALVASSPVTLPSFMQPGLSLPVLAFTIGVALVCGLLLGLAPAAHSRLARLSDALRDSARGSTGVRSHRLRSVLVVAEVTLAIVLLVGAGLMIRSMQKLTAVDPGFDAAGILTFSASVPRQPGPAPGPATQPPPFVASGRDILERVRAVPGVISASLTSDLPLSGGGAAVFYSAEGDTAADARTMPRAYVHWVTPDFFATLGIPMAAGRTFDGSELAVDSRVVIVSRGVVRRFWPDEDPIGKRITLGRPGSQNPWLTIVGVVGDVKYRGLPENPTSDPDLYFPAVDRSPQGVIVRAGVDAETLGPLVRAAARSAHPSIVVFGLSTLGRLVDAQTAASRFTTWVLGLFAAAALVLSMVGIYGVMSYLIAQRTREFGIRLALGATRSEILRVVLRQGARLIAVGAALGIVATAALSRLLGSLLYQVSAFDISAGIAVLLLVSVALISCVVPAVRATRVNPIIALRSE
jgi:predicted permease